MSCSRSAFPKVCSVGQSQGFRQMFVIIEKIILYYIWIIYIIKNYYFKLFKEGGFAKHKLFLKGAVVVKVWEPLL
jgi:hypothetical protein